MGQVASGLRSARVYCWWGAIGAGLLVVALGLPSVQVRGPAASGSVRLRPPGVLVVTAPGADSEGCDGLAVTVRLETGRSVVLFSRPGWLAYGPSWSPDGREVAFVAWDRQRQEGSVFVVDQGGGRLRWLALLPPRVLPVAAAWSPDGHCIAFGSVTRGGQGEETTDAQVYLVGTDGSQLRALAKGFQAVWSPDAKWLLVQHIGRHGPDNLDVSVVGLDGRVAQVFEATDLAFWAADSQDLLLCRGKAGCEIVRRDGTMRRRLAIQDVHAGAWTTDGSLLMACTRQRSQSNDPWTDLVLLEAGSLTGNGRTVASFRGQVCGCIEAWRGDNYVFTRGRPSPLALPAEPQVACLRRSDWRIEDWTGPRAGEFLDNGGMIGVGLAIFALDESHPPEPASGRTPPGKGH